MTQFVVPMYESEAGWGGKVDGHAGPFDTTGAAKAWQEAYNAKYNNEATPPAYYIAAQDPVVYTGQTCDYRLDLVTPAATPKRPRP